jgi:preprotein translocase subunit SecD
VLPVQWQPLPYSLSTAFGRKKDVAMFKNPKIKLLIVLALVMAAIVYIWTKPPRLGLDLQGGTRLTLEARTSEAVPEITRPVMESLLSVIERRVNGMGIAESIVQKAGDRRLIVEIPGVKDPEEAKRILGRVGKLEFKELRNGQWVSTGVSGSDLSRADIASDQGGYWYITFELNPKGAEKFGELTSRLAPRREPLGIFFDEEQISSPNVNEPILQGSGQITGQFTHQSAKELADTLNAGALPVNIAVIEENTVGAILGAASIHQSLMAGGIGLGLVLLFMLIYYRSQGLVADLALGVYTVLTYALFLLFNVTFTLAGIAGFILSIGMAVDANILIFERTREELQAGRTRQKAIDAGFDRAFSSILDSNVTTLITCALLWFLGTGSVKGFAFTLAIGVAVSMFSAIWVTRTFLQVASGDAPPSGNLSQAARMGLS